MTIQVLYQVLVRPRFRRSAPALLAGGLVLAGVLTGCGGDDDDDESVTRPPTPPPTSVTLRPGPGPAVADRSLGVEELPAGWTQDTSGLTARPPCVQLAYDVLGASATDKLETNFSGSNLGPFLTSYVVAVPPGTASLTLQDAVRAYQTCGAIELQSEDLSFTGQVVPEPSPNVGEESYALRVELTSDGGFALGSKVTLVRVGDYVGSFAFGALNNGGIEQLDDVLGRALAKFGA